MTNSGALIMVPTKEPREVITGEALVSADRWSPALFLQLLQELDGQLPS